MIIPFIVGTGIAILSLLIGIIRLLESKQRGLMVLVVNFIWMLCDC